MKCPKCQAENKDSAKFCKNCGINIVQATGGIKADAVMAEQPVSGHVCKKCGEPLKETAKFCRVCGQKVDLSYVPEDDLGATGMPQSKPMGAPQPQSQPTQPTGAPQPQAAAPQPQANKQITSPQPVQKQPIKTKKSKTNKEKKSSSNTGLIVVAIVLAFMLVAAAAAVVLFLKARELPFKIPALSQQEKGEAASEIAAETGAEEESGLTEEEIDELLSPIDELVETGKNEIEKDEELSTGIEHLGNAVEQYLENGAVINDEDIMEDKLTDAYEAYCTGILKQVDMLDGQPMDGGVGGRYGQMISEIEDALEVAAKAADAGFELDTEDVQSRLDSVKRNYPEKLILTFNEFTKREQWSRTESWELMSGTFDGGMFEEEDLDNPVRLRYAYALAWFIQKENSEGVANGDKTPKAAAEYIAGLIQDTDYSLLLLREYVEYCKTAGKEYEQVQSAYDDIVEHIATTQGLKIGVDVDLEHFWYFNDFGEYSVDDVNGVTKENREWIRNRMSGVTF